MTSLPVRATSGASRASRRLTARDIRALLWPIARRLPAYARLAWAVAREPGIPRRHKRLLLGAVLYTVTPAHMLLGPVPVIGQLDSVILLLAGLRDALRHCPLEVCRRHFVRLRLTPDQLDRDFETVWRIAREAARSAGRSAVGGARFAGRVAAGFARRRVARLAGHVPAAAR